MHTPPMRYTHEGRHRLDLTDEGAILGHSTDVVRTRAMILDRIDRSRPWLMMWPEGMHDIRDGRPHVGRSTGIRTRVLQRAAELRTELIDAYYCRRSA